MKLLRIALVLLVVLLNLAIAPSSWADRPKFSKNPDYVEVTKTLNRLLQEKEAEGTTSELQQKIDELQFQKAAIESGINWGQCQNQTGKTLAVYGPKSEESKSTYDNELYFLAEGESTPDGWDCSGVYLPRDIRVAGVDLTAPVAYQILDGTKLIAKTKPDSAELTFNVAPAKVLKENDINWSIPNVSQAFIDSRIPNDLAAIELDD